MPFSLRLLAVLLIWVLGSAETPRAEETCRVRRTIVPLEQDSTAATAELLKTLIANEPVEADYEAYVLSRVVAAPDTAHLPALYAIEAATRCGQSDRKLLMRALEANGAPSSLFVALAADTSATDWSAHEAVSALSVRGDGAVRGALAEALTGRGRFLANAFATYMRMVAASAAFEEASGPVQARAVLEPVLARAFQRSAQASGRWMIGSGGSFSERVGTYTQWVWAMRRMPEVARRAPAAYDSVATGILDEVEAYFSRPASGDTLPFPPYYTGTDSLRPLTEAELQGGRAGAVRTLHRWGAEASLPLPYVSVGSTPDREQLALAGGAVRPMAPVPEPARFYAPVPMEVSPSASLADLLAPLATRVPEYDYGAPVEYAAYALGLARQRPDASLLPVLYQIERSHRHSGTSPLRGLMLAIEANGAPSSYFLSLVRMPDVPDCVAARAIEALGVRSDPAVRDDLAAAVAQRSGGCRVDEVYREYLYVLRETEAYAAASDRAKAREVLDFVLGAGYGLAAREQPAGERPRPSGSFERHLQIAKASEDNHWESWSRRRLPALAARAPAVVRSVADSVLAAFEADARTPLTEEEIAEAKRYAPWGNFTSATDAEIAADLAGARLALEVWAFDAAEPEPYALYGPAPSPSTPFYDVALLSGAVRVQGDWGHDPDSYPDRLRLSEGARIAGENHDLQGAPLAGAPPAYGLSHPNPYPLGFAVERYRTSITGAGTAPSVGAMAEVNRFEPAVAAALAHPALVRGSAAESFASDVARPVLYYADISGGTALIGRRGAGVLVADGRLELPSEFEWAGLVVVRDVGGEPGALVMGAGAQVLGGVVLLGDEARLEMGEGAEVLHSDAALRMVTHSLANTAVAARGGAYRTVGHALGREVAATVAAPVPLAHTVVAGGSVSNADAPFVVLARTQGEFERVVGFRLPGQDVPTPDFAGGMAVFVFHGRSLSGMTRVRVDGVVVAERKVRVSASSVTPCVASADTSVPWAAVMVPAFSGQAVLDLSCEIGPCR